MDVEKNLERGPRNEWIPQNGKDQSELKSGDKSAILFAIFAITPHIIAIDGTNQPEIITGTFFCKKPT